MSDFDEITIYSSVRSTYYPFNSSMLTILLLYHYELLSFSEILSPNQVEIFL